MDDIATNWNLILTLGISTAALRLIWIDLKKLEIEFETLAIMAVLAILQSCLFVENFETFIRLFSGITFFGILVFCIKYVPGMARIGAGDPPLIGVIAFMVAPYILHWAALAGVCIMLTCGWYSIRRGKKLFKSMFPAAPPLLVSAILVYVPAWGL
jgi:hypothetical protein